MILHVWHGKSSKAAQVLHICAALLFAWLLLCTASPVKAADQRAALSPPLNLSLDGMQATKRSQPVVLLFSLPGCSFCEVVRQNYLAPLLREGPEQQRPLIREVQITGTATFAGFSREQISHHALAKRYGVRFAPTVVMVDGMGNLLTLPIVGGDTAGLYGGYLDNALAEASRKLTAVRRTETRGERP